MYETTWSLIMVREHSTCENPECSNIPQIGFNHRNSSVHLCFNCAAKELYRFSYALQNQAGNWSRQKDQSFIPNNPPREKED